jgi:cell wall-associated NlpC family hydrolase
VILGNIMDRYPVTLALLRCIGIPYWTAKGTPSTPWTNIRQGVDCSGFVQMALVHAGLYRTTEPDRRATADMGSTQSLANICIATKVPRFGDLAIYEGHVMFALDDTWVIGASGGDSTTVGNNPRACVQLRSFDYRRDFLTWGTLKPEHRL